MNLLKLSAICALVFGSIFLAEYFSHKTNSAELASRKTPGQEAILPVPQAPDNAAHRDTTPEDQVPAK